MEADSVRQGLRMPFANLHSAIPYSSCTIDSDNGQLISDKKLKLDRWKEYYEGLLNRPPLPLHNNDLVTSAVEADPTINVDPPTEHEIAAAIWRSRTGKAPGVCGISTEMLKAGGPTCITWLSLLL